MNKMINLSTLKGKTSVNQEALISEKIMIQNWKRYFQHM